MLKEVLEKFELEQNNEKIERKTSKLEVGTSSLSISNGAAWYMQPRDTFNFAQGGKLEWTNAAGTEKVEIMLKDVSDKLGKIPTILERIERIEKVLSERKSTASNKRSKTRRKSAKKA